ncbi:MAG: hypothetical protein N2Z76_01540 [Treponemataceae bacterium]|nr:hypothetical protein [Treponemataceae bacterium]
MKRLQLVCLLIVGGWLAGSLGAQPAAGTSGGVQEYPKSSGQWSDMFYVNIPIVKIYPYSEGFMVLYQKSGAQLGRLYLPERWFTSAGGKGELVMLDNDTTWPYLVVFYKEGKFAHVRLYVKRSRTHQSWGILPQGTNLSEYFKSDDLKIEF